MALKDWVLLGVLALMIFVWWLLRRAGTIVGKKVGPSHGRVVTLLEETGYEVLKAKPKVSVRMEIDGKQYPFELCNDLLVKKHGMLFLVYVRRDTKAVRLQSKLWRGTLLRDALAFRTSGVVMVNMEKETLQEVRFRM